MDPFPTPQPLTHSLQAHDVCMHCVCPAAGGPQAGHHWEWPGTCRGAGWALRRVSGPGARTLCVGCCRAVTKQHDLLQLHIYLSQLRAPYVPIWHGWATSLEHGGLVWGVCVWMRVSLHALPAHWFWEWPCAFPVSTNSQVRQLEEQLRIMDQTLKALMAAEDKVLMAHVWFLGLTPAQTSFSFQYLLVRLV